MPHRILNILLAALLCPPLAACSWFNSERGKVQNAEVAVVNQHPDSVWNLKMGRDYAADGRFELAKEHYLLALAAAQDPDMRRMLNNELQSVDLMIQTMR